ncbi:retrovirus-related pol polyprotein from transposon TNT 1-94 [Tanacetum coccineum]
MVEKDEYNRLSKRFSELEQHCISLEIAMQLNKEIFQKNNTSVNQTEPSFNQLFELNNLKAELRAKDISTERLKANIICLNKTFTTNNVNKDIDEIETINIELEHRLNIAKSRIPFRTSAAYLACMYVKLIQELLGYVRDTFPDIHKPGEKLVAIMPINKKKKVRFADTVTSSGNIPKATNRPLLSSTGVNPSTSASGSKPLGNTKNDRISRTLSSNENNNVEVQSRKVKSSLNKRNSDSKNACNEHVKHPVKGAQALCSVCNECLFDANHVMCLIDHVNSMNVRAKSASKKNKKRKEWKPTGKVFNSVGYKWKPTGRTFTLVGNAFPLTRLTATNKVPLRVPIPLEVVAPKQLVTRVLMRYLALGRHLEEIHMTWARLENKRTRLRDLHQHALKNFLSKFSAAVLCVIWVRKPILVNTMGKTRIPIRSLGRYSTKLADEGYKNTIELPVGNNVEAITHMEGSYFPTFLAQFFPPRRTAKLRNDILMFQQHHGESISKAWTRFKDLLRKVPHHCLDLWLQIQIFYDHVDGTIQKGIDYATGGRLRKLRPDEAWSAIERITQLEDYMQVTAKEFMEFSSEVTRRLKKRINENENKPRKIEKITKYPDTKVLENNAKHEFLENLKKKVFPTPANFLYVRHVLLIHASFFTPRNNIFGFKPGERANLSRHSSSNSLTIQLPTQNDTTFTVDDLIKRDPSLTARLHTELMEEVDGDYEEGDEEGGNEGVGGSADIYRNMSQGDWQVRQARWIDQHDAHWGRINAWMGKQDERAHWMYDHTVRQFQHMSTRDNLEPYLQIDPFPGFEADYPTYGYQGHMPPGYTYRPLPPSR